MKQKRLVIFGFLVFMLVFLLVFSSIASAAMSVSEITAKLGEGVTQVIDFAKTFFSPIFVGLFNLQDASDETLFPRILLLILIYALSYISLTKSNFFIGNKAIVVIVSVIVAVLGMRYLPEKLINVILLPYGAFAIALSVLLPFLIYFFFVHEGGLSTSGRRLAWILFAAVFFGLWISRYQEIGEYNWIYILGIIGVGICLLLDSTIHKYYGIGKLKRTEKDPIVRKYMEVERELMGLVQKYGSRNAPGIPPEIRRYWRTLEQSRKQLRKEMS